MADGRARYVTSFQTSVAIATTTGFRLELACNRPAEAYVDVLTADEVDPDDVIAQPATLQFGRHGESPHLFAGVVASFTGYGVVATNGEHLHNYRIHVVHPLALLAWNEGAQIFQDLDVKGVIQKALEGAGIGGDLVEFRLTDTYAKRDFCVQYNESLLAFVSRLAEEEGIHFFTEIDAAGETKLVFADDSTSAAPIDGDDTLKVNTRGSAHDAIDAIVSVVDRRRVVSGKFSLNDFDFVHPKTSLLTTASGALDADLEVYDYPGLYFEKPNGDRLAKARLEAAEADRHVVEIEASCTRLAPGRTIKIEESIHDETNGEFFVTEVLYEQSMEDDAEGNRRELLRAHAKLLPKANKYRPPRVTPRPVIEGPQTARVVAPAGAPDETIHTEEHGRCKVKFHWDLAEEQSEKCSAWFRTAQLQTSGSMVLPRIGWEVIVEFLEGNPDRPVIVGKLYNGLFSPPYALPEGKTRTAIRSATTPGGGGANEIRMEDKAGGEELMMHAQFDKNVKAANNKTKNVGGNESRAVKANRSLSVGADQTVKISNGAKHTIGGSQTIQVGGMRKVEVNAVTGLTAGGGATTTVGGMQFEMVGNPLEALIALAAQKVAEKAAAEAKAVAGQVVGAVTAKVNQVMAPVNAVVAKAQAIGNGMQSLANGNLGAAAGVLAGAAGLPSPGGFAKSAGGGGGGDHAPQASGAVQGQGGGDGSEASKIGSGPAAAANAGPGGSGSSAAGTSVGAMLGAEMNKAIQKGMQKAAKGLKGGDAGGGGGGGGQSGANQKGPDGSVATTSGGDSAKGPGHALHSIGASLTENVGAVRVLATADAILENAAAALTQNIGAARAELVWGNRAESVEGMKTESTIGSIIISKSHETEAVGGAKTAMIGGAIVEKIQGGHSVTASGPATFIGAMHKVEAQEKITIKVGASEVVLDGGGLSIKSPMVLVTCGKIEMPKAAAEE